MTSVNPQSLTRIRTETQNRLHLMDLGPVGNFEKFPARVEIAGRSYFLVQSGQGYSLFSMICPHKGDIVLDAGEIFECPSHGWTFDHQTGNCLNTPNARLRSLSCRLEEGHLLAEIPFNLTLETPRRAKRLAPLQDLNLTLHAHASLQLDYRGFELLLDPWLVGPTYLGSWIQFPPSLVDVDKLDPDAILITHEHSDHFHEPTLQKFSRDRRIYVPDFPNRRMVERLAALGFTNVYALPFGERTRLTGDFYVTMFEPDSTWNDAIALLDIDGFRILNINDSGLNQRIAARVGSVDMVASAFSSGASGYPLEWYHLTDSEKERIMGMASESKLQMLRQAAELYKCDYLLPFASHFALWHPLHRHYREVMKRNTIKDVINAFAGSKTSVIDLLPGESWDAVTGEYARQDSDREKWFDHDFMLAQMDKVFDAHVFEQYYPPGVKLTVDEIEKYLLQLNDVPEIVFSENLTVILRVTADVTLREITHEVAFEIQAGELRILDHLPEQANQIIVISEPIMNEIIYHGLSWEEPVIGYWCRLERYPSMFQADFWRLLQAPYFKKSPRLTGVDHTGISLDSVVAEITEKYGDPAERIMRRYGLYCGGCHRATYETLALAGLQHGIEEVQLARLVIELNRALN